MNICLIQTHPAGRRNNVRFLGWTINQINADLYVLPELFTTGFDYLAVPQQWPTDAEVIPEGLTSRQILGLVQGRPAGVVCGLLEQVGSEFYNVAAVIGYGTIERYRQRYPATTTKGRVLPIQAGADYQKIMLCLPSPHLWTMGFMICHEYYRAEEFFREYKARNVSAVVLIADSSTRTWLKKFPDYCREYALPAIVCNAAGPNGGGSCIISATGNFVPLWTAQGWSDYLDESPIVGCGSL